MNKLNSAVIVGMPENLMNIIWSNVVELGGTYMVSLSGALNGTILLSFSDTKGDGKKRYSSTAVRFPLLYYPNRLIVKQFSLRARAECARPCARTHDGSIVYNSTSNWSNTLFTFRSSVTPSQKCPEFPSKSHVFVANSQNIHKIN